MQFAASLRVYTVHILFRTEWLHKKTEEKMSKFKHSLGFTCFTLYTLPCTVPHANNRWLSLQCSVYLIKTHYDLASCMQHCRQQREMVTDKKLNMWTWDLITDHLPSLDQLASHHTKTLWFAVWPRFRGCPLARVWFIFVVVWKDSFYQWWNLRW